MNALDRSIIYRTWFLCVVPIFIVLTSCDNSSSDRKSFVLGKETEEIIGGGNLNTWLQNAPFGNELKQAEKDRLVFTNAKQVFPFMNRYYDQVEELSGYSDLPRDTVLFSSRVVLFQDPIWGDVFVGAALLYDDREVFLKDSYMETGSPVFGGVNAISDLHRATLYETNIFAKHEKYKTGIYHVEANYRDYLLGFYQQEQLVFETVVPLLGNDTLASLRKLKEINRQLKLNIPEWELANVGQLQQVDNPQSFWQDPFVGIYPDRFGNNVYLKIKGTSFIQDETARQGDYYFTYPGDDGDVSMYTLMQPTKMNREEFHKANKNRESYRYWEDVFYEERAEDGYISGTAKTYYSDQQYLEIHYRYPEKNSEAKRQVHHVLRYVKTLI